MLEDRFPQLSLDNIEGVVRLLDALDLADSHARYGLSSAHALSISGLAERTGRWWIQRLYSQGYLRKLPEKLADAREVVPEHWRVTRALLRHVQAVLDAYPESGWSHLTSELRLGRSKFLPDINPARIGISGATDYDHDVTCQRVLSAMVRSPRFAPGGVFIVEPRVNLHLDDSSSPWGFDEVGQARAAYLPDAELRERQPDAPIVVRSVLEYERYQSRRDAWSHVQRFLGYLHTRTLPYEPAVLRFVVDSPPRRRAYIELIEAFADYVLDKPHEVPGNKVTLAVSDVDSVLAAPDPLDDRAWARIVLSRGEDGLVRRPVLHPPQASPYDDYFKSE